MQEVYDNLKEEYETYKIEILKKDGEYEVDINLFYSHFLHYHFLIYFQFFSTLLQFPLFLGNCFWFKRRNKLTSS